MVAGNEVKTKHFLDIKVGDIVIVSDEYGHDFDLHYFKVESIEFDDEYATEDNPKGMRCYGIDLDCWDEETEDYGLADEYIGCVTEGNFVGFARLNFNEKLCELMHE